MIEEQRNGGIHKRMQKNRSLISHKEIPAGYRDFLVLAFLFFSVFIIYFQTHGYEFISLDDPLYVVNNKQVHKGLSLDSIGWAFSLSKQGEVTNWHPLTWFSHMVDYQLFGLNPGMHHMGNVLFHALNAMLLFLALRWMTGSVWKSAFVASLFALHPVNVDSVAWIAERKNLLSTTFWMLTLIAYFFYTKKPGLIRYLLIVTAFCLGCLAKPMLMTLPFVLLLLDYWPLGRIQLPQLHEEKTKWSSFFHDASRLVLEKIPLMILSFLFVYATMLSLKISKTIMASDLTPMGLKIKNAIVSYPIYLGKMVWPKDLSIFYPFPDAIPLWQVMGSIAVLLLITALALIKYRKYPYGIVGWLWFLGTLVPVIGIVQAGLWPAIGERWAYIPYVGLFITVAWGVPDLLARVQQRKVVMAAGAAIILTVLASRTWFQIGYWKDDFTLFSHCIELNADNYVAHVNLAVAYAQQKKTEEAVHHFTEALRIHPNDVLALDGLGRLYNELGQWDTSIQFYSEEVRYNPKDVKANYDLGSVYAAKGDIERAIRQFSSVISLDPRYAPAYLNLGVLSARKGEVNKAREYLSIALKLNPDDAESHCSLGVVLMNQGEVDGAIAHFKEALRIDPSSPAARNYLVAASSYSKKMDEDLAMLEQKRLKEPDNPKLLEKLAVIYSSRGENAKALEALYKLIELQPGNPDGYYNIACVYAKQGKVDESLEWLHKAISRGFKDWNLLQKDKDLDNLRNTRSYKDLIEKIHG